MNRDDEEYDIELDFDEVHASFKANRTFLISDASGMGKSTTLAMLQSKLFEKLSSSWIVFVDLKIHFKAYRVELESREEVTKFFTEKILKIDGFEAEIFVQLFNDARVVLLMDGLDEICPSFKEFIFGLMADLQKFSGNYLWMSTRPHLLEELKSVLNPIVLTLKPLTETNRREFLARFPQPLRSKEGKIAS